MAFTVAFILAALTACAQAHRYATGGAIPVAATSRGHLSYGHDTLPAQRGPFLGAGGYDGVGGFDQGFPGLVSGIADGYRSQIRGVLNNVGRHGGCGVTGNDCPIGFECVNNGRGLPYCEEINRLDRFGRNGRRGGFGSIGQGTAPMSPCYELQFPTGCRSTRRSSRRGFSNSVLRCVYSNGSCQRFNLSESCPVRGEYNNIFASCIDCERACAPRK